MEDCYHIAAQGKSNLGPTRKQHDFFVMIRMSNKTTRYDTVDLASKADEMASSIERTTQKGKT